MKKQTLFLAIFVLALSFSAFAQTKDEAALKALIGKMADAQHSYDVVTLANVTTDDYIEISPLGEFDPREKMLGFYKPELKPADITVTHSMGETSIRVYDKFAVVIAQMNFEITMKGVTSPPRGIRGTYVCRKDKGVWKVASAHYTNIRPVAAALTGAPVKTE